MTPAFGANSHKLDFAGRLKLREEERRALGDQLVLACGQDGCVNIFTPENWDTFAAAFDKLPANNAKARRMRRLQRDTGQDCEVDAQGRIRLADVFLKWAGLGGASLQTRLVHAGDRWELWEESRYWDALKHDQEVDEETQGSLDAASTREEGP